MKTIIIAAGRGKRMKHLSQEIPKCLLEIAGKPILRHQIDVFRACGIERIAVVKGYKKELINFPDVRYYINEDYQNNNILNSLFYAEDEIDGELFVSYGDILFSREVVEKLKSCGSDISIVVDTGWVNRYQGRDSHPISEAESVVMDSENNLIEIGKILKDKVMANGEFTGLMKLSAKGCGIFKKEFHRVKSAYSGKPFQRAQEFSKAYLTDMLQELLGCGYPVKCVCIDGGFAEIDTPEDYQRAEEMFKAGVMDG